MQRNELIILENELMRQEVLDGGLRVQRKLKRQRHVRRMRLLLGAVCIGIFAAVVLFLINSHGKETAETAHDSIFSVFAGNDTSEEKTDMTAEGISGNLLMLVNKDNALPEEYEPELHWLENGTTAVSEEIYEALQEMLTDGTNEGLTFVVASGYRSREYQERLLDEDIALSMSEGLTYEEAYEKETKETMPPGYSEHETGLAVDIVSSGYQILSKSQEDTQENQWLQKNCSKYGFILRYPEGSEPITGISYEPWHFRYVGTEAAADIMSRGITLEEYLEMEEQ